MLFLLSSTIYIGIIIVVIQSNIKLKQENVAYKKEIKGLCSELKSIYKTTHKVSKAIRRLK